MLKLLRNTVFFRLTEDVLKILLLRNYVFLGVTEEFQCF